ncbi:nucleotide disphospho-sugar-binding domain-containing protein [Actinomadura rayongensis]|uniref:DUF1205 domain-containing protein n=1 Tax=Actinomadura rayongensis TaxID=1429076 RepID=A0A6I4W2T8_9ACTN|nr:DUF1205 domain-containing protein [Actinomadura rayongensis]
MRFLFVTGGSAATVFALAPLAHALRLEGHEVFMAANEPMVPVIAAAGLPAVSLTPLPISHFISTDRSGAPVEIPTDPAGQALFTGRWFGRMAAASLPALRALAADWRPDVLVGGTMCYAVPLLGAELGIPHVRHAWDAIEATAIDPGADEELKPELAALGLTAVPAPDLFVDLCPPSLLPPGAAPGGQRMRLVPGGGQRLLEPWMYARGERRRVLVTAGSRVAPDPDHSYLSGAYAFLRDLVATVDALDAEMLVAAPEPVAAEVRAELDGVRAGWIPLDVVAPTCDLIVHHGGGVTSLTAMNAGVPQVVMPQGTVLVPAAERLAAYGAAVTLGDTGPEAVADACDRVLSTPSFRDRAGALAEELHALPLPAEVAGRIEALAA